MIQTLNADIIINLHLSAKRKDHQSRNRLGYQVFIVWYFVELNGLSKESKADDVSPFWVELHDEDSWDRIFTPPQLKIHASLVTKAAACMWKYCTQKYKDVWDARGNQMNQRSLPASFKTLPRENYADGINDNVMFSLYSC